MTKQNDILRLSALHSEVFRAHYPDALNNLRLVLEVMMIGNVHASVADYADRIERHIQIRLRGMDRARRHRAMISRIPKKLFYLTPKTMN